MPSTRITVKRRLTADQKQELIAATHASLVNAFSIPDWDKLYIIDEKSPDAFESPPDTSNKYTLAVQSATRSLEKLNSL